MSDRAPPSRVQSARPPPRTAIGDRFVRYLVTGGSAAVMDLVLFLLLLPLTGSIMLSALISFVIAVTYNFLISAHLAFGSDRSIVKYVIFATGACMGLIINVGVTTQTALLLPIPLFAAKILGIGTAFVFNFLYNHFVTFARAHTR